MAQSVENTGFFSGAREEGKATVEPLGEVGLSDAIIDLLNAKASLDLDDDKLLRLLARALGHHLEEKRGRRIKTLNWIMSGEGDGYELQMEDGSEFSFLVRR